MAEAKARAFEEKAEDKLKAKGFKKWFGGDMKEQAADLYQQAAAQWKRARNYEMAAAAHVRQAEILDEMKSSAGASCNAYREAAIMYKKADRPKDSIAQQMILVDIYRDQDKNVQAAKAYREIAQLETELAKSSPDHGYAGAIAAWENAAECHDNVDQETSKAECEGKVADLCAETDQLSKAAQMYERLAARTPRSGTNWGAPKQLWKATICHMVTDAKATADLKTASSKFEGYRNSTPKFADCREAKLLVSLFTAFDNMDPDAYASAIAKYDRITRLPAWETKMLLLIKTIMSDGLPDNDDSDPNSSSDEFS